ncbi:hypothetical protein NQ176_g8876 [Zarea fungicola]|uniref:Uncharacterized protein n=1 Tax=Zarea fungicola TaxID=93591 RepID=A0ACC1MPT8_9HYPO|nr:hypothetical protein NQ176_g8876 [Lecanicillium fungicola]
MSSTVLQSLVKVRSVAEPARRLSTETAAPLTAPSATYQQTHSAPQTPPADEIELASFPIRGSGASIKDVSPTPRVLNDDLEMSRPSSPDAPADAVALVPTVWEPYMNRWRLLLTCASALAEGMSDSAAGALIPYMEK